VTTDKNKNKDNSTDTDTINKHVPAPNFIPNRSLASIMKDVKEAQQQPWLLAPEARVPQMEENQFDEKTINIKRVDTITPPPSDELTSPEPPPPPPPTPTPEPTLTDADIIQMNRISAQLKQNLEQKYRTARAPPPNKPKRQFTQNEKFFSIYQLRSKLPAYVMKDEIVKTISENQITVVSGDTGCGKTTQVPQLVLDDLITNNRGAECNIICTQPRRISAIGVAERIAQERCER